MLKFLFSMYLTPQAQARYKTRSPDTIAPKIWALNSQQNIFASQNRACAQHTRFGVFAHARVCMTNTIYLEFCPHILGPNQDSMLLMNAKQFRGLGHTKKKCQADFHVSGTTPNLGIESQDGENQRGIYFFDYLTPKTIALYFRHINISPPPKYGGQTPRNALTTVKTMVCTNL